jgi:hypothetical protein
MVEKNYRESQEGLVDSQPARYLREDEGVTVSELLHGCQREELVVADFRQRQTLLKSLFLERACLHGKTIPLSATMKK